MKLFNDGAKLAEKFKDNNDDITSDKVNMNSAIQELKREVNKFFNKQLEILKSQKTNQKIKSYSKKIQEDFETKKSKLVNKYKEIFNNDEENLGTFIDIYFQTKALAIFNGRRTHFMLKTSIIAGIACIAVGVTFCVFHAPAFPVGMFLIGFGVGILLDWVLVDQLNTSDFKKNERAFSEAVSKTLKKEKQ